MSSQFNLCNYGYETIINEMRPIMERHLKREALGIGIRDLKLVDRSDNIADFLVITTDCRLWIFKFKFSHPERWETHKLQSSCRIADEREHGIRSHFVEVQGMNELQASKACMNFFKEFPTCLQKEAEAQN